MSGADLLVASLVAHGVQDLFGLPGLQLDHVFNSLYRAREKISVIHTRHEQATAYMAFGYAQAARRPGVSLVVPGPGALNALAALSTAYACNAPVMFLTGQIPSAHIEGGLGYLHEIPGQLQALASATKWQGRIETPEDVGPKVAEAFRQMMSGRKRPVALELPPDISAKRTATAKPITPVPRARADARSRGDRGGGAAAGGGATACDLRRRRRARCQR